MVANEDTPMSKRTGYRRRNLLGRLVRGCMDTRPAHRHACVANNTLGRPDHRATHVIAKTRLTGGLLPARKTTRDKTT
eukprot:11201495-Lingulodinium_polyedra.AAC.1